MDKTFCSGCCQSAIESVMRQKESYVMKWLRTTKGRDGDTKRRARSVPLILHHQAESDPSRRARSVLADPPPARVEALPAVQRGFTELILVYSSSPSTRDLNGSSLVCLDSVASIARRSNHQTPYVLSATLSLLAHQNVFESSSGEAITGLEKSSA